MINKNVAVRAETLSKMYRMYDHPEDRLKQMLWGRFTRHGYGREFWALRDFACEIHKGEMVGIIGKNGSGKSTLLQMLAGTLNPTTGSLEINGKVSALLELGSGFNPEYSGRDNIILCGTVLGLNKQEIEDNFEKIIDFSNIGEFIDQPVKTYSSGMAVRLAFAVASSVNPDIFIVDEALAVGDLAFQQKCFRRFQEIRSRGTTIIYVTHDLGSVIQHCDRAIVLNRGGKIAEGSPKEMVDLYKKSLAQEISAQISPKDEPDPPIGAIRQWNAAIPRNPNCQEYGDGAATITDWGLIDEDGDSIHTNDTERKIRLVVKVLFHRACIDPIIAFTIRDLKGNDLCGSNTLFENNPIGSVSPNQMVTVTFDFLLPLPSGTHSLCLGCTELEPNGVAVHHRLYDVLLLETINSRRFVGIFDVRPSIKVIRNV